MPTYTGGHLLPPLLDSAEILSSQSARLLQFEYYRSGSARLPTHTAAAHNIVIPIQDQPLHAECVRDGIKHDLFLHQGDMAVTPAGTSVRWQWHSAVEVILIWIDPQVMRDFVAKELKMLVGTSELQSRLVIHDVDLLTAAKLLKKNMERVDLGQSALFDALCRVFLTTLVQKYRSKEDETDIRFGAKLSVDRYRSLVDFLDANLHKSIPPADLAAIIGVSISGLNRLFRATLETTPGQFIMQYRLDRARALVGDGSMPLALVAAQCGFSDQAHLSRKFRSHFGVAPSAYRQSALERSDEKPAA